MNIIHDNTFNLHKSLLNNKNRNMKVSLKSMIIGDARYVYIRLADVNIKTTYGIKDAGEF